MYTIKNLNVKLLIKLKLLFDLTYITVVNDFSDMFLKDQWAWSSPQPEETKINICKTITVNFLHYHQDSSISYKLFEIESHISVSDINEQSHCQWAFAFVWSEPFNSVNKSK